MAKQVERSITISGEVFTINDAYAEGATINALEAGALNQTRAENIGNSFRTKVKALKDEGAFDEKAAAAMQEEIAKYAGEYQFSTGGGRSADPIQKEAKGIAMQQVDAAISAKGVTKTAYIKENKDKYDALVAQVQAMPEVQKKAAELVKARSVSLDINI